ncbi:hypothetical protein T492DRAFT_878063 [Pavlovales sp. CCMP2436]|nr:hypothetical protein T492DRAFT_878063 [Pavlovales sp. CCMP2436]
MSQIRSWRSTLPGRVDQNVAADPEVADQRRSKGAAEMQASIDALDIAHAANRVATERQLASKGKCDNAESRASLAADLAAVAEGELAAALGELHKAEGDIRQTIKPLAECTCAADTGEVTAEAGCAIEHPAETLRMIMELGAKTLKVSRAIRELVVRTETAVEVMQGVSQVAIKSFRRAETAVEAVAEAERLSGRATEEELASYNDATEATLRLRAAEAEYEACMVDRETLQGAFEAADAERVAVQRGIDAWRNIFRMVAAKCNEWEQSMLESRISALADAKQEVELIAKKRKLVEQFEVDN